MQSQQTVRPDYREAIQILKPFCKRSAIKTYWQLFSTIIFLWGSLVLSFFLLNNYAWGLILTVPATTVFMCRSYVIEHDCGHQSFMNRKSFNAIIGNLMGLPIFIPYSMWKYIHDSHHMNVGNLDKRDLNPEIWTMTVAEFRKAGYFRRILYRFIRSSFSRFIIAPVVIFGIIFRIPNRKFDMSSNISVVVYDVIYVTSLIYLLDYATALELFVIFFLPLILFFCMASYIFYAQHQFEDTYWEKEENWSYEEATLHGSSYISAPQWINWLSGNVCCHNIHHLISAIPNYNLRQAMHELQHRFHFKTISIWEVYRLLDLKLWDEDKKKLVRFSEI